MLVIWNSNNNDDNNNDNNNNNDNDNDNIYIYICIVLILIMIIVIYKIMPTDSYFSEGLKPPTLILANMSSWQVLGPPFSWIRPTEVQCWAETLGFVEMIS